MPIKDAGKKAMRSDAKKTLRNRQVRGTFRSAVKNLLASITAGDKTAAKEQFTKAQKSLDKAAQKGIIKKNAAARTKSRLSKKVKALG